MQSRPIPAAPTCISRLCCRVAVLLYTGIVPQWRACISCSAFRSISRLLYYFIDRCRVYPTCRNSTSSPRIVEGIRGYARASLCVHTYSTTHPGTAVCVRSPWHPQNGRFASASSIQKFQTVRSTARDVGPSATVIIPRTIYDARLDNGRPTVKLRRCYFDLS